MRHGVTRRKKWKRTSSAATKKRCVATEYETEVEIAREDNWKNKKNLRREGGVRLDNDNKKRGAKNELSERRHISDCAWDTETHKPGKQTDRQEPRDKNDRDKRADDGGLSPAYDAAANRPENRRRRKVVINGTLGRLGNSSTRRYHGSTLSRGGNEQ